MVTRIHHVAIVVADLEQAYRFWRDTLGLPLIRSAVLAEQGVRAALLGLGDSEIELLQPLDEQSSVGRFLARRGGGLHHICFATGDIGAEMQAARERGLPLLSDTARPGLAGMVCFVHPKATCGVLIEYAQPSEG